MQAADPRQTTLRDSLSGQVLRGSGSVSYHLADCIGEGGQGWVFRANWDEPDGMVVIVKVLRPDTIGEESLRRFQREAEVLRMLSTQPRPNPNIVRFYDHAVAEVASPFGRKPLALPFTVLEYVNGTTLDKVLQSNGGRGLPVARARRILRQISQALEFVHAQNVVHRDLKPSNILLATDAGAEIAKVTDFGLVKLVDANLVKTSTLAGASLGYAPPEQYEQRNKRVGPRTDIFALAAMAYEMLSGQPAFPFVQGENPLLIITRILNGPRPSLLRARETLSPELQTQIVHIEAIGEQLKRALSADPNERHESVTEFWSKLEPPLRAASEDHSVNGPRSRVSPFEATARQDQPPARAVTGVRSRQSAPPAVQTSAPRVQVNVAPTNVSTIGIVANARAPEAAAANPAAWAWKVLTRPIKPDTVKAAVFGPGGDFAIGVGPTGLARWERGTWIAIGLPPNVDARSIRGVRLLKDGDVLLYGDRALAFRLSPRGAVEWWPIPDRDVTFLGACVEDGGFTTLVGKRPYRGAAPRSVPGDSAGVIAQFTGSRLTLLSEASACSRLLGATRLASGTLLACGDWGGLVRLEMGVAEHVGSICGGHLVAIERLADGGAVTVGAGGHALYVSPKLEAQLEAVQTTRDLLSIAIGEDGSAWAGSAQARLLRRSAGNWMRMSGDVGITQSIMSIWAAARVVRAVCDDGAVIEGRLA